MAIGKAEVGPGEIKITFEQSAQGKISFAELGLSDDQLLISGGNLRMEIDLGYVKDDHFFRAPTIEIAYKEKEGEIYWNVEFNDETVLEKLDHSGHVTVLLLSRKELAGLVHRHQNTLLIHGDFPTTVHIDAKKSYIHILELRGE